MSQLTIQIEPRTLHFREPAGTSRGVYRERRIHLVRLTDGKRTGTGECAPLPKLSQDDQPDYDEVLNNAAGQLAQTGLIDTEALRPYPSILFGLETALLNFQHGQRLFDTAFSRGEEGIPINGLVWMGTAEEMQRRIEQKIEQGYRCIKLKVGAIDFESETELLRKLRSRFSHRELEIRLDANGAFNYYAEPDDNGTRDDALYKLELLSQYAIHSIEQPIKAGQWANMAQLVRDAPVAIALDEELIGVNDCEQKAQMLNIIRPAYVVIKPSLHGGISGTKEWADVARRMDVGSWITSALESNVGLNAIAQLASHIYGDHINMPQGLGTGQLFTDNLPMPLEIRDCKLWRTE